MKNNLYTPGNEFKLQTENKYYVGPYNITDDGYYYTGKTFVFNVSKQLVKIIKKSSLNQEQLSRLYYNSLGSEYSKYTWVDIKPYIPINSDIQGEYIMRYFATPQWDLLGTKVIEISKDNYEMLSSHPFYKKTKLKWYITNNESETIDKIENNIIIKEGITTKNKKEIEKAIKGGFKGLEFLFNNLLQFSLHNSLNNSVKSYNENIVNNQITIDWYNKVDALIKSGHRVFDKEDVNKNRSYIVKKSYNLFNMHYINNYNIGILTGTDFNTKILYAIEYNNNNIDHFQSLPTNYDMREPGYIYFDSNNSKYYCFVLSDSSIGQFEKKRIYIDNDNFDNYAIFHCNNSKLIIDIEDWNNFDNFINLQIPEISYQQLRKIVYMQK